MQTVADMRGVGVKNRGKFADILCGRPLKTFLKAPYLKGEPSCAPFLGDHKVGL